MARSGASSGWTETRTRVNRDRLRRIAASVPAGASLLALVACTATPQLPAGGGTRPLHTVAPAQDHHDTGDRSELVTSLPVLRIATKDEKRVVFSQEIELTEGQVLLAVAEFQITNDLGVNVFVASQIVLSEGPGVVTGREITAANGENVTPDMHHGQQTKSGTYQSTATDTGVRYVNVVVWAAASRAGTGQRLRVDQGYGRLSVVTW